MTAFVDRTARLVRGRRVLLVGNAESLLTVGVPDVRAADVIVRMNRGGEMTRQHPILGTRTDILLISGFRERLDEFLDTNPQVVWMTPRWRDHLPADQVARLDFYPLEWWQALSDRLGHRPSTGCMGVDLLSRLVEGGELHLHGFDFWKTPTHYTGRSRPGPHSPEAEEAFARERVPAERIHRA